MEAELDQVDGRAVIGPERRLECLIAGRPENPRFRVAQRNCGTPPLRHRATLTQNTSFLQGTLALNLE